MNGLRAFQGSNTECLLCATVTPLGWLIFTTSAIATFLTVEVKRKSGMGRQWCGDMTPVCALL